MELDLLVEIGAFVGAWLLVAGPLVQAAMELRGEDEQVARIRERQRELPPPKRTSFWWWLLPPVKIVLARVRGARYRRAYFASLEHRDAVAVLEYVNAANAWMCVAIGATLIAYSETHGLWERLELGEWALWAACVALPLLCIGSMMLRLKRTAKALRWHSRLQGRAAEPS